MRVFASVVAVFAWTGGAWAGCSPDRVDLRGVWGEARFAVEVADGADERALGLAHRKSMPVGTGMLFIYEAPQKVHFWMENTLIPLDMIFMDQTGTVRRIHENAIPLDRTPIPGGAAILAVLEINGGLVSQIGITVGSELRHPGLPQKVAAWNCGHVHFQILL